MLITHNIPTYSINWLSSSYDKESATGIIQNYYLPENIEEFSDLCSSLFSNKEDFKIVGHTSNVYFQPDTNICHLISTKKLNKWKIEGEKLYCECGVNVKVLTKVMIEEGVEGFAGMIDLPGTIGGAIYGNSSVSQYSITNLLESVTLLNDCGRIQEVSPKDLGFSFRSSKLKRNEMKGIILACKLHARKGCRDIEMKNAGEIHAWRKMNQPGPSNNLGTTALLGNYSIYGVLLSGLATIIHFFYQKKSKIDIILWATNATELSPFLFGMNRYIWKDKDAHKLFPKYVKLINRLFKSPKLEIEIW